jgi:hypothetical protein
MQLCMVWAQFLVITWINIPRNKYPYETVAGWVAKLICTVSVCFVKESPKMWPKPFFVKIITERLLWKGVAPKVGLLQKWFTKKPKVNNQKAKINQSGVDVTIFCDFCQFSAKKLAFILKNQCYDHFFYLNLALFWVKNANFFAKFFGENILKIITSVPA